MEHNISKKIVIFEWKVGSWELKKCWNGGLANVQESMKRRSSGLNISVSHFSGSAHPPVMCCSVQLPHKTSRSTIDPIQLTYFQKQQNYSPIYYILLEKISKFFNFLSQHNSNIVLTAKSWLNCVTANLMLKLNTF